MLPISADWTTIQNAADALLAQGVFSLRNGLQTSPSRVGVAAPGNYLISLDGTPRYIGEAHDLSARLRQQFTPRSSTFYKNYVKTASDAPRPITAFALQLMTTRLGRKEIEDFGIANIPTPLNRFQLDKRMIRPAAATSESWDLVQAAAPELLAQGATLFWSQPSAPLRDAYVPDAPGVYALWGDNPRRVIYIGESSGLRDRHRTHCGQTYFSALRRNVGTNVLGFELHEVGGKRRYFTDDEERQLDKFLDGCLYHSMPVHIGRIELEEQLIARELPIANRKVTARTPMTA